MSVKTTVGNSTLGDNTMEIIVTPHIAEGSALPSLDSLLDSIIEKKEPGRLFVEAMDKYAADVTASQGENVDDMRDSEFESAAGYHSESKRVVSSGIRIDRSLLDNEYGEEETSNILDHFTSAAHDTTEDGNLTISQLHDDGYVANSSLLGDNSGLDYNEKLELQRALERSFTDLRYDSGFTNVSSFDTSHVKLTSYGWYGTNSSASTDCTLQQNRRRLRKTFASINSQDALFRFMKFLLNKAHERELMVDEDEEEKTFVFVPYFPNSYWYNGKVDEFSSKSMEKKIGIRTKLDKYHANLILSVFYILYSNFELTTDETIFEKGYRDGVLMRDDNFELFKFFDKVLTKYPEDVDSLSSLVNGCLDIFNLFEDGTVRTSFFGDDDIQYQIWLLTYSNQVKEVRVTSSSNASFYTIGDLVNMYDDVWYSQLSSENETSDSILNKLTNTSRVVTEETHIEKKVESDDIVIMNTILETTPLLSEYKEDETSDVTPMYVSEDNSDKATIIPTLVTSVHMRGDVEQVEDLRIVNARSGYMSPTRGVFSLASTPVKRTKKSSNLVDGVLAGLFEFLKIKND